MLLMKKFFGLVKKTLRLVHTSNNLPEWQAIKLTFFAPCLIKELRSNYQFGSRWIKIGLVGHH